MALILTAEQARLFDRLALDLGVPSLVLMENACRGAATFMAELAPRGPLVVLCGPGNNAGDGLGIARILHQAGRRVLVCLGSDNLRDEAEQQRRWCQELGVEMHSLRQRPSDLAAALDGVGRPWVVDALFGTGLSRPLETPWVDWVNELAQRRQSGRVRGVLAVDLPSGLDADLAVPIGPHVVADATATFAGEKPACLLSPNAEACGTVRVVDLGFSAARLLGPATIERIGHDDVRELLPRRPAGGHKGTFGHLLVVGGSRGMEGAPALTAEAALRAGVGMVTVAAPAEAAGRVATQLREALTLPLDADAEGSLTIDALQMLGQRYERYDALALGPGLGDGSIARKVARRLALTVELPLVLDADGLNAFAGRLEDLRRRAEPTLLTPHVGELARLLEVEAAEVISDPLGMAMRAAETCGQTVVLKGAATVIAASGQATAIVRAGSSGMATAGSGDVLTGVLGALLAAGLTPAAAARVGVWAHATAGAQAARERSAAGMMAGDLLPSLARVWAGFESA